MSIEELLSVVTSPSDPWDGGDEKKWDAVQAKLGITLPRDYFDFGRRYGTGQFFDPNRVMVKILNPFSAGYYERIVRDCDMFREIKIIAPNDIPYDIFPIRPGLLPWGHDDNGWTLFWLTEGPPTLWPILLMAARESVYSPGSHSSLTSFLASAFSGEDVNWTGPEFFCGPKPVRFIPDKCPYTRNPDWLTPTVREVAEAIRQGRAFDRLPILADALEEAGCTSGEILDHCRSDGRHVRRCWVVDLLLEKS